VKLIGKGHSHGAQFVDLLVDSETGLIRIKRIVASGELGEPMHIEGHASNENSGRFFGAWRTDPARRGTDGAAEFGKRAAVHRQNIRFSQG
jgi:hypothetical protein